MRSAITIDVRTELDYVSITIIELGHVQGVCAEGE